MINTNLITCTLCRNYFADPRQIPCSHSFCFDCISGRFDDETFILICPKCEKLHQYHSRDEFQDRCMPDGFLASMVTQYKKNQSRSSAISAGLLSRPASSMSRMAPKSPSMFAQQRPSSVVPQALNRLLIAKCQACNIRDELAICTHCENVICMKCSREHQRVVNNDVKRAWDMCKTTFQMMNERSIRFQSHEEECNGKVDQLQALIDQQSEKLIQTVHQYKNVYADIIEKHLRTYKQVFTHEQVIDEYESVDQRLNHLLKSADITADKIGDFSFEIEHLQRRLDNLNKLLDSNELKFPVLTLPEPLDSSSLFGTLNFIPLDLSSSEYSIIEEEDEDYVFVEKSSSFEQISSSLSTPVATKKKLLWQLDYKSVPYYIRTYDNQLFVCDKYGHLSIYKLTKPNYFRQKPIFLCEVKLFLDFDEEQTIIDSFVVHHLGIIVLKRKKNEVHATIYLFTHDGKLITNGVYLHNYPSRELIIDLDTNILWSLEQKQPGVFFYHLPNRMNQIEDPFRNRHAHVQFAQSFAPKHMSVNKSVIAVLDKNRQAVHVYDKQTREELYEHVNNYHRLTHFCWDMALFSDSSLLIKLDEISSLKTGPSKHVYLQLDTTPQRNIIGIIEEVDTYGMIVTATDEILIGLRMNSKGTVKCYI